MGSMKWASIGAVLVMMIIFFSSGGKTIKPETATKLKGQFDYLVALNEPLCIVAGPFPKSTDQICFECDKLMAAKLIEKREGNYELTQFGRSIYRKDADERFNEAVRKQNGKTQPNEYLAALMKSRPRFCLGETYAETLVDALPIAEIGPDRYQSAKFIPGVRNPHDDILDPRLAPLAIPCAAAEAGKPMLCKQQLLTFQYAMDGSVSLADVRYGPWVNEK